jgi:hypothetical protein
MAALKESLAAMQKKPPQRVESAEEASRVEITDEAPKKKVIAAKKSGKKKAA